LTRPIGDPPTANCHGKSTPRGVYGRDGRDDRPSHTTFAAQYATWCATQSNDSLIGLYAGTKPVDILPAVVFSGALKSSDDEQR